MSKFTVDEESKALEPQLSLLYVSESGQSQISKKHKTVTVKKKKKGKKTDGFYMCHIVFCFKRRDQFGF